MNAERSTSNRWPTELQIFFYAALLKIKKERAHRLKVLVPGLRWSQSSLTTSVSVTIEVQETHSIVGWHDAPRTVIYEQCSGPRSHGSATKSATTDARARSVANDGITIST